MRYIGEELREVDIIPEIGEELEKVLSRILMRRILAMYSSIIRESSIGAWFSRITMEGWRRRS